MRKSQLVFIVLFFTSLASAQTIYSSYNVGSTTITNGPGGTVISGPNGIMISVSNNNSDEIQGYWSTGIVVDINKILTKNFLPSRIVINDFSLTMPDGESITAVALTSEEAEKTETEKDAIINRRAQAICNLTETYPHLHSININRKWFPGLLIDVSDVENLDGNKKYKTYKISNYFTAKYFKEITCGNQPRGY